MFLFITSMAFQISKSSISVQCDVHSRAESLRKRLQLVPELTGLLIQFGKFLA